MELLTRQKWMDNLLTVVCDPIASEVTIATWAAPKMWASGGYVKPILVAATEHKPDKVCILVGLPRRDTEDFTWQLSSVFEVAEKWPRLSWRVLIGSHGKFVHARLGRGTFGMVGSVNFTDSTFDDLGLYVQKGMNKVFETHVRRHYLLSKNLSRFSDPRRNLPDDWKDSVMAPVGPPEPAESPTPGNQTGT